MMSHLLLLLVSRLIKMWSCPLRQVASPLLVPHDVDHIHPVEMSYDGNEDA